MKQLITNITLSLMLVCLAFYAVQAQHSTHDAAHKHRGLKAQSVDSDHSLYHLQDEWTTHRSESISLSDFSGDVLIVVMFYGNCTDVCPILIQDAWRLYRSLDPTIQKKVQVAAVSFDYVNDTPDVLNDYAQREGIDLPNWHLLTGERKSIRHLAMMLGVQYRERSDGMFEHSNLVTVLDTKGQIGKRIEGLGQPMEEAREYIESVYETGEK